MISDRHQTIFIHIEKTGGTSIEHKLGLFNHLERGVQDHTKLRTYEHIASCAYSYKALKYASYQLKNQNYKKTIKYLISLINPELTQNNYDNYFKFTIVRNTWDRLFSYYYNIINDEYLSSKYGITKDCSFSFFYNKIINADSFNQLDYIKNSRGDIPLDFIGRFENLNNDFKFISAQLNLADSNLPILLKRKDKIHYKEFYNNSEKDLIYKLYRQEIDFFKFEF